MNRNNNFIYTKNLLLALFNYAIFLYNVFVNSRQISFVVPLNAHKEKFAWVLKDTKSRSVRALQNYMKWNISKRCRLLKSKRKELYRRNAWNCKCSHNQLANKIVAVGTDIRVEDMSISGLAKRSKKTTISKKNGRPVSKKRYGKTILSRAPAMFINAIERKLSYIGIHIKKLDAYEIKASQYNHITNSYKKKPLSQRWSEIGNDKIQRDLYSAFLIRNTTPTLDHIDQESCIKQYDHFKVLHDIEIKKLKKLDNPSLRWYIV